MPKIKTLGLSIVLCLWLALGASHALAQGTPSTIKVTSSTATFQFAKEIKFDLKVESSAGEIQRVDLYYTFHDGKASNRLPTQFEAGKSVTATATKRAQQGEFAPQLDIRYYWRITDAAGNTLKTDTQTAVYSDDRFKWQKAANDRATVFWYNESEQFGKQMLQWSMEGLDRLENKFGIKMSYPIHIVIYKNKADMALALSPRGDTFDQGATVLGEARSTYGTLLMLNQADPKVTLWHELSHLVLHDLVRGPYESNLPAWLDEGLAMYNESDDKRDSYAQSLDEAIRKNDVFELRSMTSPNGIPTKVGIWYGQARSVVDYLLTNQGGKDKLLKLIDLLSTGVRIDPALRQVYGFDQTELNNLWRQSVKLPTSAAPAAPAQPPAAAPQPQPKTPAQPPAAAPTTAPQPPAQAARPTPQPAAPQAAPAVQPPAAPAGPSRTTLLVLAGLGLVAACSTVLLAGFGVVGAVVFMRRRR